MKKIFLLGALFFTLLNIFSVNIIAACTPQTPNSGQNRRPLFPLVENHGPADQQNQDTPDTPQTNPKPFLPGTDPKVIRVRVIRNPQQLPPPFADNQENPHNNNGNTDMTNLAERIMTRIQHDARRTEAILEEQERLFARMQNPSPELHRKLEIDREIFNYLGYRLNDPGLTPQKISFILDNHQGRLSTDTVNALKRKLSATRSRHSLQ